MKNRVTIIFLLLTLCVTNLFATKVNKKGEYLVKSITVNYDYSTKDDYRLTFEYDTEGNVTKMCHYFLNTKDQYELGYDNRGLRELKYASFHLYKKDGKLWKKITDKEKHYSFNKHGLLYKKLIYFTNIKQRSVYSFWYDENWTHLVKMESEVTDSKDEYNNYHGITNFTYQNGNLFKFLTDKDVDKKEKIPYRERGHYNYFHFENLSNIDFNYLLVNGDLRTNIEGCIGLLGKKMPNLIFYEYKKYGMDSSHYEYQVDSLGKVHGIYYKIKKGSNMALPEKENIDWVWRQYMTIKIEYVE